jgi:hypothetical protein
VKRLTLALRAFFAILTGKPVPAEAVPRPKAAPATPPEKASDGALHLLSLLQRDARLLDFLMEDISGYSDDQVGAAVRNVHEQCREALGRYIRLRPVIDGVEGTFTSVADAADAAGVKFLGNVPAKGRPSGGLLRHKGWRAETVNLPRLSSQQDHALLAPAEIEVE